MESAPRFCFVGRPICTRQFMQDVRTSCQLYLLGTYITIFNTCEIAIISLILKRKIWISDRDQIFTHDDFNANGLLLLYNFGLVDMRAQHADGTSDNVANVLHDHHVHLVSL